MLSGPAKANVVFDSGVSVIAVAVVATPCCARLLESIAFQSDGHLCSTRISTLRRIHVR